MQEDEAEEKQKHPIEMTSEELLDYVVHPDVAERLKERVRDEEESDSESD